MKPKTTERQIQETCSDFLALDGWRRVRTDLAHLRGMGVQEKGMADDLYLRYLPIGMDTYRFPKIDGPLIRLPHVHAEVLWIEWKRRTGKVAAHQHAWHAQERARGALTLIAGIDFNASVEGFLDYYFQSGLARKVRDQRKGKNEHRHSSTPAPLRGRSLLEFARIMRPGRRQD